MLLQRFFALFAKWARNNCIVNILRTTSTIVYKLLKYLSNTWKNWLWMIQDVSTLQIAILNELIEIN